MILRRLFFLLVPAIIFLNCSGPEQLTIHQEVEPLEVDGNLSNWNVNEALLKSTSEIDYYATQIDNNLYLFIEVKGLIKNSTITKSGLIVYLSNSEDNRKRAGLGFPTGTYHLMRQYPNAFEEFTTDMEWSQKPENRELLTSLSEEIFSSIMIVERPTESKDPEFGFIDKSQLEIDGFEIATNEDRRFISVEMKIPIGETSLFNLDKDKKIWLGFSIEPPDFNFRLQNDNVSQTGRDRYGQRSRREANMRYAISRNLGGGDEWFIINLQ